jgi:transposase
MANLLNPDAAGIDISSKEHFVAVPKDRAEQSIRCFQSFTSDLHDLASWLKTCNIKTVAMESTGVYWFQLFTILLDYGFEVYLVNAYHVKNVPGRKSDVSDARWLQELHSFGLLNTCFQPDNMTRRLRNYVRQRKQLIKAMTRQTNRMLKALEMMNVKLNNVIRDIHGKTGKRIIKAILQGQRNAKELIKLRDPGIKASAEVLEKSLVGNWREEQLFNLRQALEHYSFLQKQLLECDLESEKVILKMTDHCCEPKKLKASRKQKNQPKFNVEQHLYNVLGVDVTKIYGIKSTAALTIYSETGADIKDKFPSEKQFLSWLNVVPDNKISGGKVLSSKVKKKKNVAGQAFRDAASTLWRAQNPLGDYLRKKKAKSGARKAIVATARKMAAIYYKMVTQKVDFDSEKLKTQTTKYFENKARYLKRQLEETNKMIEDISKNQIEVI